MNTSSLYHWNKKRSKVENNCGSMQQKFLFICFFIIVESCLYDRQESSNTRHCFKIFWMFLRINGTKEGKNEIWEECEERLNCFLEEKLDMNTNKIWIQCAHRVGKETGHDRLLSS